MVWDFSFERECVELKRLAPAGYHIGLHIKDTTPLHRLLDYPASWVAHYTAQAYVLRDLVVAWGLSEVGCLRWSAITLPDPFDILGQARAHGLVYGATVSTGSLDARTIGSVARPDRELTDEELAQAEVLITDLHRRLMPPRPLTPAQLEALRLIAKGYRYADAADALQISQSALKARITAARQHLRARTTAEAIQRAASYDLI
ncbi:autoinducer binding domain-containing protein [Planktomarina temperata]|nr:autoinducer binding domain-containing protein [Planktomarina temperata]